MHVLRYLHRGLPLRRAVLVPGFEYAETDIRDLTHERDKLREWMWTVPAPPALDPAAEEPKEVAAARKTADKLAAAQAEPQEEES